ncbi:SNAP receptor [Nowakowskiella sp. JEL0407]|nr:SNAP receptor [Nowakowskiella sp. JEL0407]
MDSPQIEDEIFPYKKLGKSLIRLFSPEFITEPLPTRASIVVGEFIFHYIVENGVIFLTLCERTYPRLLAFSYLIELVRSFFQEIASDPNTVISAQRPYALIKFEPSIQVLIKRYLNVRQLHTPDDLADLPAQIQSIPLLHAHDVLGDEYYKIFPSQPTPTSNPFPNIKIPTNVNLEEMKRNVANTISNFTESVPLKDASPDFLYVFSFLAVCVFFIDAFNFMSWLSNTSKSAVHTLVKDHEGVLRPHIDTQFGGYFVLILGVMCPLLLFQIRSMHTHKNLTSQILDSSLIHATVTIFQIFYAASCSQPDTSPKNYYTPYVPQTFVPGFPTSAPGAPSDTQLSNPAPTPTLLPPCYWGLGLYTGCLKVLFVFFVVFGFGNEIVARWGGGGSGLSNKRRGHRD